MTSQLDCALCHRPVSAIKSLSCRHKLCIRCLARSSSWGGKNGVSCPKCGTFSKQDDIYSETLPQLSVSPVQHQNPTAHAASAVGSSSDVMTRQSVNNGTSPADSRRCTMCDGGLISHKCFSCDMLMCTSCRRTHARIPVTADHMVKDVHSLAIEITGALKQEITKQKDSHSEIQKRLTLISRYKAYLKRLELDVCNDVDKAATAAKAKIMRLLEEQARRTKADVRETIATELELIDEAALKKNLELSRKMTSSLQRAVTSRDEINIVRSGLSDEWESLSNIGEMMTNGALRDKLDIMVIPIDVVDDISEINIQFCDIDISRGDFKLLDTAPPAATVVPGNYPSVRKSNPFYTKPQRVVKQATSQTSRNQAVLQKKAATEKKSSKRTVSFLFEDPEAVPGDDVMEEPADDAPKALAHAERDVMLADVTDDAVYRYTGNIMLSTASNHEWRFKNRISVPKSCDKIAIIQRHFWCVCKSAHAVMVVNLYGQQVLQLEHESMRYPRALTQYNDRGVVVACHAGFGLLEFDFAGEFVTVITNGSFSDVCCHEQSVVALETDPVRLLSYGYSNASATWVCNDEIIIDVTDGNENDSVVVSNAHYFISSINSKSVLVYTLQGALFRTHRDFLPGGIGAFHQCHLATVDDRATMVLIDKTKHRLLTLSSKGAIDDVTLENEPKVVDLLLDRRGFIWILDDRGQIHRYQQELPIRNSKN